MDAGDSMTLLKRKGLVGLLFRPQHDYLPGTTIFREIDVELIATELELSEKGREDGEAGIPSSSARRPSVAEQAVIRQVTRYWTEAMDGARRAYEALLGRTASLTVETEIDLLLGMPDAVRPALAQIARDRRDGLLHASEEILRAERDLAGFVAREGLGDRFARQSASGASLFLVLAVAFLIELVVNASIFSKTDEFGLAGAIMKVVAIPVLNMGGTFLLTYLLARHVVRRGPPKLVGAFGIFVTSVWAFGFNLGVAHWRDSLAAQVTAEAGGAAMLRVFTHTFQLASDDSWMLFGVGCAAAVASAIKAWTWRDPHPGFSRKADAAAEARQSFDACRTQAMIALDTLADGAMEQLEGELRKAETAGARRPELAARAAALNEDLAAYREHLLDVAADLTGRYREANQRARGDTPPSYFDEEPALDLPIATFPPIEAEKTARNAQGLLANAMRDIATAANDAKMMLPTLGELIAKTC